MKITTTLLRTGLLTVGFVSWATGEPLAMWAIGAGENRQTMAGCQYPDAVLVENDLWVIYSINKQDIAISRLPWMDL